MRRSKKTGVSRSSRSSSSPMATFSTITGTGAQMFGPRKIRVRRIVSMGLLSARRLAPMSGGHRVAPHEAHATRRDTKADEPTTTNTWGNRATPAISTGSVSVIQFIDTRYQAGQMHMISQSHGLCFITE